GCCRAVDCHNAVWRHHLRPHWSTSDLPDWLWLPAGLGGPHVFDDRPRQYVAHYLLGARLHDPNWIVLRTAIGNVFRNVAIAHPTVRRFHFVCHRRDLGRILRTHHGPVSCRYHRLDWFSWRVPGRHGHNFWRSGPDYQGAT